MKSLRSNTLMTVALGALVAVLALGGGVLAAGAIAGSGKTIVTVRLWDDRVAAAYKSSFAAFEAENPGISVDVTVIPWSQYWGQLDDDVAGGRADDIFWVNNSYLTDLADGGKLMDIDAALGTRAKNDWDRAVVREFTRDGTLWGVPQLSDAGIGVYYNKAMLAAAGIDPAVLEDVAWSTDPAADTLLPVLQALTRDSRGKAVTDPEFDRSTVVQYGYNAGNDLQAILLPTIGSNGGAFDTDGVFTFAEELAAQAIGYQVDLINTHKVAPPAVGNTDPDSARDAFVEGRLALFQSGLYNLPYVFDGAEFEWGAASMPAGPAGRVSVTNGIVAAGNAHTAHPEATTAVLKWLGSAEGNHFVGASGAAVPGVVAAQQAYFDFWGAKDVDVKKFFEVLANDAPTVTPPTSVNFGEVEAAYSPILDQVFSAELPLGSGLQQAQDAANAALAGE
ncbi:ABC transporter substrate-binding protein [Microterricola pindariensis]|nr:sugar ABC transporter substrate-binding protein [Microterricola pindariensis]